MYYVDAAELISSPNWKSTKMADNNFCLTRLQFSI